MSFPFSPLHPQGTNLFSKLHLEGPDQSLPQDYLQVIHESPQLIIIKNGHVEAQASHGGIHQIDRGGQNNPRADQGMPSPRR